MISTWKDWKEQYETGLIQLHLANSFLFDLVPFNF